MKSEEQGILFLLGMEAYYKIVAGDETEKLLVTLPNKISR